MIRRPPISTRTDTLFPYTTLFRSRRYLSPDQLATDQIAADFVCPSADVVEFGVAEEAFYRPFLGVARAAERLDRLERGFDGVFAGQQARAGGVEAGRLAGVAGAGDGVDIGARAGWGDSRKSGG